MTGNNPTKVQKTDAEWRKELTPEQYYVTRQHGTERPFSSPLNVEKREGMYVCVACGNPLFKSDAKYESGSGWPSFWQPVSPDAVTEHEDSSMLMQRIEIRCGRCDAHLGHVFPDGPQPTGLRYCMNGTALKLMPKDGTSGEK
ncbi:MAG: peptide-methionine (R)-S-oxide reductase MsrB [Bradyrhizobiaceae bacterium]|nr:peptide-methionine (R)-S-oxide reductase MsrB [Bradyrhizobiaceae bacterium]